MRLNRLDLVRYGKFSDRIIDFGAAAAGSPDLHVVYGPNEAGKSTLFSAFLDFLFGIEHSSVYGFLHPYATMRVGGEIEVGGRLHQAYRVKRKLNTLLGTDEQPLPDNLFSGALGSIDRTTYQMMFSLNDDSIEKGGESILKSEGELGTLLFSASSGLPDSNAILSALKLEADAFYKPQGRKHHLAELKAELEALKEAKAAIDVNARDYAALRKARDSAADRHDRASATRTDVRLALDFTRDKIGGLDLLDRLRRFRGELAAFGDVPEPPSAWHGLLPQLMQRDVELSARLAQIDGDLQRRRDGVAAITIDESLIALEPMISELEQSDLEARHRTAIKDMPSRLEERERVSMEIGRLLTRLGRAPEEDPALLVLTAAITGLLQALAQRHSGLAEKRAAAGLEMQSAQQASEAAAAVLVKVSGNGNGLGAAPPDPAMLSDLLRRIRQDDCLRRQRAARREIAVLEERLEAHLSGLSPFAGQPEELAAMRVPTVAELAEWRRRSGVLEAAAERLQDRLAEERAGVAAERARLSELTRLGGFAVDDVAQALREERHNAWHWHLEQLDRPSATAFERALKRDDEASALRLAQSERLAEARGLSLSLAERQARLLVLEDQDRENRAGLDSLTEAVAASARLCGLPEETSIASFEVWLARRAAALEAGVNLRAAQRELETAVSDEQDLRHRLIGQLARFDAEEIPDHLEDAVALADALVTKVQAVRSREIAAEEAVERTSKALEARREALVAAEDTLRGWASEWDIATRQTWLGRDDRPLTPPEITSVLAALQELEKLLQRKFDLEHRIDGMSRDQSDFSASVKAIAERLTLDTADPLSAFVTIKARLAGVRESQTVLKRLTSETEDKQAERRAIADQHALQETLKGEILDFFGCETLAEVGKKLEAVKARDHLSERIVETGRDLCARLKVASIDDAEAILAAVDATELDRDIATLELRLEECDREAADTHAERREAEKALAAIDGDDRAAHLDEHRRTVLIDIEEKAMTYLRLRAGILSTEMALRLYRERHRSAMMQRASAAFSRISGGEYSGLATQSENGKEFLIANAATGASKVADDLSKGTRFQLYLALRMAGYHEIAATRESLPFIADDIMETFDDGRAEHAFGLMADMARVGQVIYLTHHQHLCEIAEKACPGVTIHTL